MAKSSLLKRSSFARGPVSLQTGPVSLWSSGRLDHIDSEDLSSGPAAVAVAVTAVAVDVAVGVMAVAISVAVTAVAVALTAVAVAVTAVGRLLP